MSFSWLWFILVSLFVFAFCVLLSIDVVKLEEKIITLEQNQTNINDVINRVQAKDLAEAISDNIKGIKACACGKTVTIKKD